MSSPGPAERTSAGPGLLAVPPGDPEALAATLDGLLADERGRAALGAAARDTVERAFSWAGCGRATVEAYADAVRAG